jgi:hypothetical protein
MLTASSVSVRAGTLLIAATITNTAVVWWLVGDTGVIAFVGAAGVSVFIETILRRWLQPARYQ